MRMPSAATAAQKKDAKESDRFTYVYSCDVPELVQIKIGSLEGTFRDAADPTRVPGPMLIEATVFCHGRAVGSTVSTSYASRNNRCIQAWNEWIRLPIRYSELSRDAFVHFTLWDQIEELCLPKRYAELARKERKKAATSLAVVVDDFDEEWDEWTSAASVSAPASSSSVFPRRLVAECTFRLFDTKGLFRSGVIDLQLEMVDRPNPRRAPCEPWQFGGDDEERDRLIRAYQQQRKTLENDALWLTQFTVSKMEREMSDRKKALRSLFIVLEMAEVLSESTRYDIVFYEMELPVAPRRFVGSEGDNELGMDNPCEGKHAAMARNTRAGAADRQLKPTTAARKKIESVIELPPSQPMTAEAKDLIWKFRYYLSNNDRALAKFLRSVNWDEPTEVDEALQLLSDWKPMRPEDALELLSPTFSNCRVRAYAVERLYAAAPDRLQLFLPQLVQALKYEQMLEVDGNDMETAVADDAPDIVEVREAKQTSKDLASFLVEFSTAYPNFANCLFWHLKVEERVTAEKGTPEQTQMYRALRKRLIAALENTQEARQRAKSLIDQEEFVQTLKELTAKAKEAGGSRANKESVLKQLLANDPRLQKLNDLPLPIDPNFRMQTIVADRSAFFNSAMMPARLTFSKKSNTTHTEAASIDYTVIFKEGDDLRQDQLIMQMIRLMDSLLRDSQLDLKLTPYAVLATGKDEGFVQFIKAMPLRDVLNKHNTIHSAMHSFRPSPTSPYGIEPEVIDNYVRSLAGYSVICYILGIGDRHLDNLLLCESGRLFHVDFGFILGRDPKPLPPPMKLTAEMIAAIGGIGSDQWKRFVAFCDEAFTILRRHANLILNLFSLMLDASIPDIAEEKDKAVGKVEHRLHLQLSDDERYAFVMKLIETSVSAKMAVITDFVHDFKLNFLG